jgi:NAD(P)-dependent dehydrogenase (short-subunit alcohol dehydrogenase family)
MRNMFSRYAVSKLANILLGKELQRRLDDENVSIITTSLNPGPVNTQGAMSLFPVWLQHILSRLWVAPSTGAIPVLYLATEPEIRQHPAKYKALYYTTTCKPTAPSAAAQDPLLARNLWETSMLAVADWVKG